MTEKTTTNLVPTRQVLAEAAGTERPDDTRWQAILARDAAFDGAFVYAVTTTGVYCRPSCPARRPAREHVRLFHDADAAERARFRPCRRCQPREPVSAPAALVDRARRLIEQQTEGPIRLAKLAAEIGVSQFHLQRTFRSLVGVTPRQYDESCRIARLKGELRVGGSVTEALYAAGYGSSSRLYDGATAKLGMTPGAYRRGGDGTSVRYAIRDCPLGRLLVAATDIGVCAVGLGDDDDALEAFLRRELPNAESRRDDDALADVAAAIVCQLRGDALPNGADSDLPLDVAGTEYQRRVWSALRLIPPGTTRTYAEVARSLGQPTAARAVARACATNPAALVVPCHRVVRGDGGLGGYRWGLDRKRRLLDDERSRAAR